VNIHEAAELYVEDLIDAGDAPAREYVAELAVTRAR